MKIAYITANTPFGFGEEFIIGELSALRKLTANLIILPRDKSTHLFHKKAVPLTESTFVISWFSLGIVVTFLKAMFKSPMSLIRLLSDIVFKARNPAIALKNLVVLPKAIYLSESLERASVSHLHAHWGTTTSTMAHIISSLSGIPWSLTLHRGDIKENNLLKVKVNSARFTRCISHDGKRMVLDMIGDEYKNKIVVIPMGVEVDVPSDNDSIRNKPFVIAVPSSLLPVKGHKYLIDACSLLKQRGFSDFQCIFYGEGHLRRELAAYIEKAGLSDRVLMPGQIPNEDLIQLYKVKRVDIVVLPSINTTDGDHEGIPVSLMEAMAHSVPVISTNTGGIPELIGDGSGIMVEEKNPEALAYAIEKVFSDEKVYRELSEKGWQKVKSSFNVETIAGELLRLYSSERLN